MKIKIDYKGKLHALGEDIISLDQIYQNVKTRYPDQFKHGILLKIQNQKIRTFKDIENHWSKNGSSSSVKMTVEEAEQSIKQQKTQKIERKIYKCWKCKNKNSSGCVICDGQGQFSEDHPFLQFCSELIQDKVNKILKERQFAQIQSQKPEQKEDKQVQNKQVKEKFLKATFASVPDNNIKIPPNSFYSWSVLLTNNGNTNWPQSTAVYNISNKIQKVQTVPTVSPSKSTKITLNLKSHCSKRSQISEFRLGYLSSQSNGVSFFGPKFGFLLDTNVEQCSKLSPQQEYERQMTKMVKQCVKYVSHQRHNIGHLVSTLKEFGIGPNCSKDLIIDYILQLQ